MRRILRILMGVMMCTGSVFATAVMPNLGSTRFVISGVMTVSNSKVLSGKLIKVAGIKRVEPDVAGRSVTITYNPKQITTLDLIEALRKNGYFATEAPEDQLKVSNYVIRFNY